MEIEKLSIAITNDWDGVLGLAPAPSKTRRKLARKTFSLPESAQAKETKKSSHSKLIEAALTLFHAIRPMRADALKGLAILQAAIADKPNIEISLSVLSGREPYLHSMSKQKLDRILPNVFDNIWLNEGYSSGGWKELKTAELVAQGKYVFHIEDDLEAALRVARVSRTKVKVYLIRNASNRPELLEKNQLELPKNVVMVDSYVEAVELILSEIETLAEAA